jgi:hypothetical protein
MSFSSERLLRADFPKQRVRVLRVTTFSDQQATEKNMGGT